jgi:uncharacterized protein (TIRG00374 family)
MRHKKIILQALIGIIILAVVLYFLNPSQLVSVFFSIKIEYFVLAMLAYAIMNLALSYRLKLIFNKVGRKISLKELWLAQFGGMLASDVTPGRSGYLITPFLIKDKVPVHSGFSAIFGTQIIDFFVKIIGSVVAVLYLSYVARLDAALLWLAISGIALIGAFALIMGFALWSKKAEKILIMLEKIPLVGRLFKTLVTEIENFQHEGHQVKVLYPKLIALTLLSWGIKGVEWMFLGMALGFNLPYFVYLLMQPLVTILQFVPISPAGLGFQESGGLIVFLLLGITKETAFVFNILARIVLLVPNLIGIYPIIKKGVDIFNVKK